MRRRTVPGHAGRAAILVLLLSATPILAAEPGFHPIELEAKPIDRFLPFQAEQRFGSLEFRGGLDLSSPSREFGSLSGLDFSSDGSVLYSISDKGLWFSARPVVKDGRLVGLAGAGMAPILNSAGKPLAGKAWGDAEALRVVERSGKPIALVSFEEVNDLRAFAGPEFPLSPSVEVPLPASTRDVNAKTGFEALAVAPAASPLQGAIVLVTEHSLDAAGNHRAWIVGGPLNGTFSVLRSDGFDVTDAAFLPDGDLLILEREVGLLPFGVGMRIRQIAGADIRPGATVDGTVLLEADLRYQIDNMEGLAIGRNSRGETIIALVSDNNQSRLQRTLLLYFALAPSGPVADRATPGHAGGS